MKGTLLLLAALLCHPIAHSQIKSRPKYVYTSSQKEERKYPDTTEEKSKEKESDLKNYSSNLIVLKNANGSTEKIENLVHIIFLDPKSKSSQEMDFDRLPVGFISFDFVRKNEAPTKYTVKYMKTSKTDEATINWYVIIDWNEDYDIVKIYNWKKPTVIKGKSYANSVVLSKYGDETKPKYEMAFVTNRIY